MTDTIIKLGNATIQHGTYNDRVYLMKLSPSDYPQIIPKIEALAQQKEYTKIFAKVPDWAKEGFVQSGYTPEAAVPRFYNGTNDAWFMSKYYSAQRKKDDREALSKDVMMAAAEITSLPTPPDLDNRYDFSLLTPEDAGALAALYKTVFQTYPFPIHDPAYLLETMRKNIVYFGIRENGRLIAASSCEMDTAAQNVEMTDFATLPQCRKQGFASFLLGQMNAEMEKRGILTAYTIARALSFGMNITFAKHDYQYAGTLINNTNISGGLESMNIWYKPLHQPA